MHYLKDNGRLKNLPFFFGSKKTKGNSIDRTYFFVILKLN